MEELESRLILTGNLWMTGAYLVDSHDEPVNAPFIGEEVFIDAQWSSSGLSSSDQFTVQFTVDGVSLNSPTITGEAGQNATYHEFWGGWYAAPGLHSAQVTVDPDKTVSETTYNDNMFQFTFSPVQPSTLPSKLILPLGGVPLESWAIINYIDVNPLPGPFEDYEGGSFTYDGHNGYDMGVVQFAAMDSGVPVFAAAAGTISQVQDGNFDRQTVLDLSAPANYVIEDLGGGWSAVYLHLLRSSVTVKVGQSVQAGQVLGLLGSSGDSTAAHLHFALEHDGDPVETFYDPAAYWVNPPEYEGDAAPEIMALGVTNSDPTEDLEERPDSVTVFPSGSGWSIWYWYVISTLKSGDQVAINWYSPDGSLATTFNMTAAKPVSGGTYEWVFDPSASDWSDTGTWQVATVVDGQEIGRTSFQIVGSGGTPTLKLEQGSTYVLDNRTTPIDFGNVAQGESGPEFSFQIEDIGSAPLATSDLSLPPGFQLVGSFPTAISPGSSASFVVQLESTTVGAQFGQVTFTTNDANAPTFGFNVSGTVSGTPDAGSPEITQSGPALATGFQAAPLPLDSGMTLTDSSSQGWSGGSLTAAMASGGTGDDRLSILNEGSNSGEIGFDGVTVSYAGTAIGKASITTSPATVSVTFNSSATTAGVQAVFEAITYQNISSVPTTKPRYVRLSVVDGAGLLSNRAIVTVVNSGRSGATPPPPPSPPPPKPSPPSIPTPIRITGPTSGSSPSEGSGTTAPPSPAPAPAPSSGPATIHVTAIFLTAAPKPAAWGRPVKLNVTVGPRGRGGRAPSGNILVWDGSIFLEKVSLSHGEAKVDILNLPVGRHVIKVIYSGSEYWKGSSGQVSETVRLSRSMGRVRKALAAPQLAQLPLLRRVFGS